MNNIIISKHYFSTWKDSETDKPVPQSEKEKNTLSFIESVINYIVRTNGNSRILSDFFICYPLFGCGWIDSKQVNGKEKRKPLTIKINEATSQVENINRMLGSYEKIIYFRSANYLLCDFDLMDLINVIESKGYKAELTIIEKMVYQFSSLH